MRLVIIGAGSQSTPHLFLAPEIAAGADSLDATLVGRHDDKTGAVAHAIRSLNPAYLVHVANIDDNLSEAFASADIIIIQARFGGYEGRLRDETFPRRFGVPGDEGLGPGGLANAWRSWPHLARLLDRVEEAGSRAAIVHLTAPLSLLTRCAHVAYPTLRWYALCELPFVTLKEVCACVDVDWRSASFDYAGVNHLGWFDRLESRGTDVVERFARSRDDSSFPSRSCVENLAAVPLKYFELHYRRRDVVRRQRRGSPRSQSLAQSARTAVSAYAGGIVTGIHSALSARDARWYYEAVAPLLAFLRGDPIDVPLFLTTRNLGYLPAFAADDVVEIPHFARNGLLERARRTKVLSPMLQETLEGFIQSERLGAMAVLNRSETELSSALSCHPWVRSSDTSALAREVLTAIPSDDHFRER